VTILLRLTYSGVLLAVFAQQLCLPIPSAVFLIAAGALSANGEMRTSIVILFAVLGCLAADGIWFWFGRRWGSRAVRLLCRFSADPRSCSKNAHEKFRRYGLALLCVAKFLPGLDGLMPPLGGAEGVPLMGFLALDAVGSLLWAGFYVGLGYVFSNQMQVPIRWAKQLGSVLTVAIVLPISLYAGWRGLILLRMIRRLRLRHISAPMLARKLKSDGKVAVLDLLNFEEETDTQMMDAIPGAFCVNPSQLRRSPHITVPDDVEMILYCSAGSDMVSARAAVDLKRVGVDKVWVLEGGLKAWREHGYPVTQTLEAPEVVADRLGINLPKPRTRSNTAI
jgi:membrane protein DedA with SNARE-associated domain/rhodanese-related sulfurtransferase